MTTGLCLGHGSAWPAARPVRGQPVQRAGELAVLYACRLAAGSARLEPVRQSAGGEWRRADLAAISHGAAGATTAHRGHLGAGRRRSCGDLSLASTGDLLVEHVPDLAHCHGSACRSRRDLAGSLAGELPPLPLNVELRSIIMKLCHLASFQARSHHVKEYHHYQSRKFLASVYVKYQAHLYGSRRVRTLASDRNARHSCCHWW